MAVALDTLRDLSEADLAALSTEELASALAGLVEAHERNRQDWGVLYYRCANPMAEGIHRSVAREIAAAGGNRSSKTTSIFAEMVIAATGVIPDAFKAWYPTQKIPAKFRGRIVGPSLTDWVEPILKPKLRYTDWNGVGEPVDGRGHWGLVPRQLLRMSKWESAWNEKSRVLHIARDSSHLTGGVLMELKEWGTLQVMSNDQDLSSFAGSSLSWVGHDEVPRQDIYRENQLRTLDVRGRIYTAFTPPDEVASAQQDASWFYDAVYQPGLPGPDKNPLIDSFTLHTEANAVLDPQTVREMWDRLTDEQREVRFFGKFLHLSGAVYGRLYTPYTGIWCFRCAKRVLARGNACPECHADDTVAFSHLIEDFDIPKTWPIVFAMDPHPRKPCQCVWGAITPSDDVLVVGELAASVTDGGVGDIVRQIRQHEEAHNWRPAVRIADPNAITQTNDLAEKGWTMRRAFSREGFPLDLANDAVDIGVARVREYLKPDRMTRRPRLQVFRSCRMTANSLEKWSYAEWQTRNVMREAKESYADLHRDAADALRYLVMGNYTQQSLRAGTAPVAYARGGRY